VINRRKNKFNFRESLTLLDIADLEKSISLQASNFTDWVLDFKNLESASMSETLGLTCQVLSKINDGHGFTVIVPKKSALAKEWRDKNILSLLDSKHSTSSYHGSSFYPARQYTNSDEHFDIVNDLFKTVLSGAEGISRADYAALEWAINEISDNVLVHSESPVGGVLLVNKIDKKNGKINFLVADCGLGITSTLGQRFQNESEVSVLDKAVREGVTRDKNIGQGNGLFGSYEISHQGKGSFKALSNNAMLRHEKGKLEINKISSRYSGTIVEATVDFSSKNLMASALTINGQQYEPVDFIETTYEDPNDDCINFVVREEARSYGTRSAGAPLKGRLVNFVNMYENRIVINFNELPIISSSFADEVVGKLLLQFGEHVFKSRFTVVCLSEQNNAIIQRSVVQRINDLNEVVLANVA
jgi:hypothetical protein